MLHLDSAAKPLAALVHRVRHALAHISASQDPLHMTHAWLAREADAVLPQRTYARLQRNARVRLTVLTHPGSRTSEDAYGNLTGHVPIGGHFSMTTSATARLRLSVSQG